MTTYRINLKARQIINLTIIERWYKMKKTEENGEKIMQYLPTDLRHEYDFLVKNNPDIEGLHHPYINLSDAFRAYFILVHYFTDTSTDEEQENMLVGIRSVDLLASALGRQNISF